MKQTIWALLFLVVPVCLFAQTGTIVGVVTDTEGNPLPGANVIVEGTTLGAATDNSGAFKITILPGVYTLRAEFIGYESKTLTNIRVIAGQATNIAFQLPKSAVLGEEVVVVGYGTQRKINLTGAVTQVKSSKFEARPITQASQALQGEAAGVWVHQNSGQPGRDAATIRIRGIHSLNNNAPLVLIDGVQGSLSELNPQDIESFTVLKDAASSAIYGSRAANGVILIQTKQGRRGKVTVEYNGYTGWQSAYRLPDPVSNSVQFMELFNKALENEGRSPQFSQDIINEFKNGSDPDLYPNTNWIDVLFRTAQISEHNISLSGGTDTRFLLSVGVQKQDGILIGTRGNRYNFRLNLDSKVSERLNVGARMSGMQRSFEEGSYLNNWGDYGTIGILREGFRAMPFHPVRLKSGEYGTSWFYFQGFRHPVALATEGVVPKKNESLSLNTFAEFKILKGLTWKGTFAVRKWYQSYGWFLPEVYTVDPKTGTRYKVNYLAPRSLGRNEYNDYYYTVFSTLTYENTFAEDHEIKLLAGFNQEYDTDRYISGRKEGFPNNDLREFDAGSLNPDVSGYSTEWALQSYFGRLNYAYRNRYLFEANFRYDGSSRFHKDNRWGFFPSFSVGWNISEESFMKAVPFIDFLKLRASWGKLGDQQIGLYRYIPTISLGQDYSFGGTLQSGAAQTALANKDITWESTTKSDIGFELSVADIDLEFSYFHELREDILRPTQLSAVVGALSPPVMNLASVKNHGFELMLDINKQIGDLLINVSGNLTYNTNKVTKLPGGDVISGNRILREGEPIDSWYLIPAEGIFQTEQEVSSSPKYAGWEDRIKPGDIKYKDTNGDGKINNDDRVVFDGSIYPKWIYGFSVNATYGNFDFSALFQGQADVYSMPNMEYTWPFFNNAGLDKRWLDAWTPENKTNELPRLTTSSYTPNFIASTFWLENASYFRVKNVQLGYTLPHHLSARIGLTKVRIYINAQNPLLFTPFSGMDPERPLGYNRNNTHPNVRIFSVGTTLSF